MTTPTNRLPTKNKEISTELVDQPTNREAVEQIKNVISGYLMDISKGHITAAGAWSFPNDEQFDIDVANAIRQTHLDLLREVEQWMRIENSVSIVHQEEWEAFMKELKGRYESI